MEAWHLRSCCESCKEPTTERLTRENNPHSIDAKKEKNGSDRRKWGERKEREERARNHTSRAAATLTNRVQPREKNEKMIKTKYEKRKAANRNDWLLP